MAKMYGKRHECLDEIYQWNNIFTTIYAILLLSVPSIIYWHYINDEAEELFTIGGRIALAFLLVFIANYVHRKAKRYEKASRKIKKDLKMETVVWFELRKLPDEYSVFQGVRLNEQVKDINFVVAGPTGVFVLSVNRYKGKVVYKDGKLLKRRKREFKKDPIEHALQQALSLHEYLLQQTGKEIYVKPIVVFPSSIASVKLGLEPIDKGVYVIKKKLLHNIVSKQDDLFKEDDLPAVKDILNDLTK